MKSLALVCISIGLCACISGCSSNKTPLDNMSRADQEKAFIGNKEKGDQMLEQMRQKYTKGQGSRPSQTQ